jgi:DNA-binding NarL/FixJ family response regulator
MPGMNGRDLARKVAALHPRVKCLFVSGYTADIIAHSGVEEAVEFIQKPFSVEGLVKKVRDLLDGDAEAVAASKLPEV